MIESGELGLDDIIQAAEMDDDLDIKQHAQMLLDQIFETEQEEV